MRSNKKTIDTVSSTRQAVQNNNYTCFTIKNNGNANSNKVCSLTLNSGSTPSTGCDFKIAIDNNGYPTATSDPIECIVDEVICNLFVRKPVVNLTNFLIGEEVQLIAKNILISITEIESIPEVVNFSTGIKALAFFYISNIVPLLAEEYVQIETEFQILIDLLQKPGFLESDNISKLEDSDIEEVSVDPSI